MVLDLASSSSFPLILFKVPFNEERTATMTCPLKGGFNVTKINKETGGVIVDLLPENVYEEN